MWPAMGGFPGRRPGVSVAVVAAAVAISVAACSSASGTVEHGPTDEVKVAEVGSLGKILVDGEGYTLYAFAADKQSGKSTCTATCADEWPPVTLAPGTTAPIAGPAIDPSLLGVTTRGAGVEQVVYDGWPLYRWPNDVSPGMATGQAVDDTNGLWYVVRPSGSIIR
jgi:predicted lipoprotein with Yx(FWY)xxD motif